METPTFVVPENTDCHARKLGTRSWRPYVTTRRITCAGFLWRNETHYGFAYEGFEVKVPVGGFAQED